jgi:hypothetical protein
VSTTHKKTPRTGPGALAGSSEARKRATVILETLAGVRTTEEAAQALEVAPARYYQLEAYALQGFLAALEPKQRGRQVSVEQQNARLQDEIARLEREVKRQQALYRTTQRALGVPKVPVATKAKTRGGKKVKRRRRTTRGDRVLAALSKSSTPEDVGGET